MEKIVFLIPLFALLLSCAHRGGTNDETVIRTMAVVYLPDGQTPADGAVVKIFDAGATDGQYLSMQTTDGSGRFSIAGLPAGEYSIWAQKDSLVTFQRGVIITPADTVIQDDTLSCPSTVNGIVGVQPQDDPRAVTIQVVGLDAYFNGTDKDGRFTLKNMAEGTYTLLLKSTEPHYTPTTVEVTVAACARVMLDDTLRLTYTGIPVVTGLGVSYDTAAGAARISWRAAGYRGLQNYCIYRDLYDAAAYAPDPIAATDDTVYFDTVFFKRSPSGGFSFSDSNDYRFRYRVAIRSNVSAIGPAFGFVDVVAASPRKVRTVFSFSCVQRAKGIAFSPLYDAPSFGDVLLAGEGSVGDSMLVIASAANPARRLYKLEWRDAAGTVVRSVDCDSTKRAVTDSLRCLWTTTGLHSLCCAVVDEAGSRRVDTARIGIVTDPPEVEILIRASRFASRDRGKGNPAFAFGDTIALHCEANDAFGSIAGVAWRFGRADGVSETMTFDTVALAPDSAIAGYPLFAAARDDDGNVTSDTLAVDVNLFAPATDTAAFKARMYHSAVVFNGSMWIFGGLGFAQQTPKTTFTSLNDAWVSENGKDWTQVSTNAPARSGHAMIAFNGKLWLVGGFASSWGKYKNDVWRSADGISWTCVTDSAAFSPRIHHLCVAFNQRMWIIGGLTRASHMNDVWSSTDGLLWEKAVDTAAFPARCFHSSLVFAEKMWVIGGRDNGYNPLNDVWYSVDGATWNPASPDADFSPRQGLTCLVHDDKMWIIGGYGFDASDMATDVWNSNDGTSWTQVSDSPGVAPRAFHSGLVSGNRMWVIAGMTGPSTLSNGVWRSGALTE